MSSCYNVMSCAFMCSDVEGNILDMFWFSMFSKCTVDNPSSLVLQGSIASQDMCLVSPVSDVIWCDQFYVAFILKLKQQFMLVSFCHWNNNLSSCWLLCWFHFGPWTSNGLVPFVATKRLRSEVQQQGAEDAWPFRPRQDTWTRPGSFCGITKMSAFLRLLRFVLCL